DAVEEVRVIALGSKAEYGSSTGVAVDVLTKQGSNAFHGQGSYYGQLGNPSNNTPTFGEDLGRDWLYLDPNNDPTTMLLSRTEKDREGSFTFGGPIVKNKVWFYTGADISVNDLKKPLWPVLLDTNNKFYDAKVSAEPTKNQQAWFSYHWERNTVNGDTW